MKKMITLSSATLGALLLLGTAAPAFAASVDATNWNSTGTVVFTPGTDTSDPGVPDPDPDPVDPDPTPVGPGVPGAIALDYASNLNFGTHEIADKTMTYYAAPDTEFNAPTGAGTDFVAMHDLRGEGTWTLTVAQATDFNNGTRDLKGAAISFNSATAVNTSVPGSTDYLPTAENFTLGVGTGPQTVATSDATGSYGTYAVRYGVPDEYKADDATAPSGPISLSVPKGTAAVGTYTTTLEYALNAVPTE